MHQSELFTFAMAHPYMTFFIIYIALRLTFDLLSQLANKIKINKKSEKSLAKMETSFAQIQENQEQLNNLVATIMLHNDEMELKIKYLEGGKSISCDKISSESESGSKLKIKEQENQSQ
jgi:hypothetical protein